MKIIKKLILAFSFVALMSNCVTANALIPYESYTYSTATGSPQAVYSPVPYTPEISINSNTIGTPLVHPKDMCFDKNGNLYIADAGTSSIIVLDSNYNFVKKVDSFDGDLGLSDFFGAPEGIFIASDGKIYVADTAQKRIVIFDSEFKCLKIIKDVVPIGINEDDFVFTPLKVGADESGNIYVISKNVYAGIIQLDSNGKFISFVGSNKVAVNPVVKLWKSIMSKEQKEKMEKFIPVEYTNLSFDSENFIFTVSKSTNITNPIKRLNLSGKDVLIRNGYVDVVGDIQQSDKSSDFETSLFVDIVSADNGMYYALDSTKGRIFVYNNEGFLFYTFGGTGSQLGTLSSPTSIELKGTDILVSNEGNGSITVYKQTEYGNLIDNADTYYNNGEYEKSVANWQKVIDYNSNFELAYAQIGKVRLRQNDYQESMRLFKLGNYRGDKVTQTSGYNKAFSEYRRLTATDFLGPAVITLVVLIILRIVYKRNKTSIKNLKIFQKKKTKER